MTKRAETNRYVVGIDAGSVSLNALVINEAKAIVYELPYKRHFGKVEEETFPLSSIFTRGSVRRAFAPSPSPETTART